MPGRRVGILEKITSESGKGPLGFGILPNIQEKASKILKR